MRILSEFAVILAYGAISFAIAVYWFLSIGCFGV